MLTQEELKERYEAALAAGERPDIGPTIKGLSGRKSEARCSHCVAQKGYSRLIGIYLSRHGSDDSQWQFFKYRVSRSGDRSGTGLSWKRDAEPLVRCPRCKRMLDTSSPGFSGSIAFLREVPPR